MQAYIIQAAPPQRFRRGVIAGALTLAAAGAAAAAASSSGWVKDAARASFPAQAARGTIAGRPIIVRAAHLARSGSISMGDKKLDTYTLSLRTNDSVFPDA